jgi:hypothetical protein
VERLLQAFPRPSRRALLLAVLVSAEVVWLAAIALAVTWLVERA